MALFRSDKKSVFLNVLSLFAITAVMPAGVALAQNETPMPPPLIIKDVPAEAPQDDAPVIIDITNPPSPKLPEAQNVEAKVQSAAEIIPSVTAQAPASNQAEPIRKIAERELRTPLPPVSKPLRTPLPAGTNEAVYGTNAGSIPMIRPEDLTGERYFDETSTLVGQKIVALENDLFSLQKNVRNLAIELDELEIENQALAAQYYASTATISTQLQTGTTPGNPRLLKRITQAQSDLEALSGNVTDLNSLAIRITNAASVASFLQDSARSTFTLTGAVEEDHVNLAKLEDNINNTIVVIERLLNNINDGISRTSVYLASERDNLRTLSLAVANGDLYSRALSNRPFSTAVPFTPSMQQAPRMPSPMMGQPVSPAQAQAAPQQMSAAPMAAPSQTLSGPRPLVKIRFDSQDVEYEQAVYNAVNQALERYPNVQFDLVAVNPKQGNAAQVAIESTRARRNAERVLRTLTQMGLDEQRINLSYADNDQASTNEVHIYIR